MLKKRFLKNEYFLEERQNQTTEGNKGAVRQVEGIQNVNITEIKEIRSGQDI